MTNKVLHAFPSPSAFTPDGDTLESGYNGMTLRDYFAAKAMAALLSRSGPYGEDQAPICREDVFTVDELAEYAYAQADAMLTIRALPDNVIFDILPALKDGDSYGVRRGVATRADHW